MRSVIRSIKNEINNYDEGERLVRELTSNEPTPPSTQMLIRLKSMLANQYQFPSIFNMLFKRLKDYDKIRHVEKSLIVIEYLLKNGDKKFVRYCQMEVKTITRLQRYRYMLNYRDYGGLIRKRAKRVYDLLKDEEKLATARAKAQGYAMSFKKGDQYSQARKQGKHTQKVRPKKQARAPKKGHRSSKKTRAPPAVTAPTNDKKKKRRKKPNKKTTKIDPPTESTQPQFESFIDVPAETAQKTGINASDDLLSGDWWQTDGANQGQGQGQASSTNKPDEAEDFGWYNAGGDGPDSGFGDDGGQFNFGDDEFFNAEAENQEDEDDEDDDNLENLYSKMTTIDNILEAKKKKENPIRNKQGKTMAEMAGVKPSVKSNMPASFDVGFINDALNNTNTNANANGNNNNANSKANDFDPFGLGPKKNATATATTATAATTGTNMFGTTGSKEFGYQPKQQQNLYPYGNDPFAGLGGSKKNNFVAANISRNTAKTQDPFSQFAIK